MPDNVAVLQNKMETHTHPTFLSNALEAVSLDDPYSIVEKSTKTTNKIKNQIQETAATVAAK